MPTDFRRISASSGLPQNFGIGHGWVEGGPLLPVKSEFYQSGLGAEAARSLSNLAKLTGQNELSETLRKEVEKQLALVNQSFWMEEKKRFAFAIGKDDKQVDEVNVLATVPMWFGSTTDMVAARMESNLRQLTNFDLQTDWGPRIISNQSAVYSGGGYHYGSVWPLFTVSPRGRRWARPVRRQRNSSLRSAPLVCTNSDR